jgi:hypothetical protein
VNRRRYSRARGIRLATSTSAFVALVTAGCGTTPTLSTSNALPQESTTTETSVAAPATTSPVSVTTATAPAPMVTTSVPVPKATTSVSVPVATPRPSSISSQQPKVQGSNPVARTDVFCGGLADVISAASEAGSTSSDSSPQGQKDALLAFSGTAQYAFSNTAQKLKQLGAPAITDGKKVQDTAVGFFTTAAGMTADQRAQLAGLDANDPDFVQKVGHLPGPDLGAASAQMRALTSNEELKPAFKSAQQCRRLATG